MESLAPRHQLIATVGRIAAVPGAVNVVPGSAVFSLDVRAASDAVRDAGLETLLAETERICAGRGLSMQVEHTHAAETVHCDAAMTAALAHGIASSADGQPLGLFSPAGHDAMAVAAVTRVGMLFIRCAGGVSHHPEESVLEADVAAAIDAMHAAVRYFADTYPADRDATAHETVPAALAPSAG